MVGDMEFTLHHRAGKNNHVDGLSRVHQVHLIRKVLGPDDVKLAQRDDDFISYGLSCDTVNVGISLKR